jgi:flagellar basal body rod protein FlgC
MSIKRRKTTGKPLLIATAGVGLTVTSCIGKEVVSGNLMPPPMVELCIDVTPDEAAVTVDGVVVADEQCTQVYEGMVQVDANAEGYVDYSENVEVYEDMTHEFELTQATDDSGDAAE